MWEKGSTASQNSSAIEGKKTKQKKKHLSYTGAILHELSIS